MIKVHVFCLFMLGFSLQFSAQSFVDHPFEDFDVPFEAKEYVILHSYGPTSANANPSSMEIGKMSFDDNDLISTRILPGPTLTNASTFDLTGHKFMNSIALDYDGDGYDEVVHTMLGGNNQMRLAYTNIIGKPLNPTGLVYDAVPIYIFGDEPIVKMAKADFDADGREELVLMFRNEDRGGRLWIQILRLDHPFNRWSILAEGQIARGFRELTNSDYEAFDITTGDFDGNGTPEIAAAVFGEQSFAPTTTQDRHCYVQLFEVDGPPIWRVVRKGQTIITETGEDNGWENVAITAGKFHQTPEGKDKVMVALAFEDPVDNTKLNRRIHLAQTIGTDLDSFITSPTFLSYDITPNSRRTAVTIKAGDLDRDPDRLDEVMVAFDGEVKMFSIDAQNIANEQFSRTLATQDEFYRIVPSNAYLEIGDTDRDLVPNVMVITSDIENNSGNQNAFIELTNYEWANNSLLLRAEKKVATRPWNGSSDDFVIAGTLGEVSGGRAYLRAPNKIRKKLITPMIVNGGPPHHFDIINNQEVDLSEAYPTWPTTAGTGLFQSNYKRSTQSDTTLSVDLNSDWAVSATLENQGSILGTGIETKATATYGEAYSKQNTTSQRIFISDESNALSDDQLFAVVQDVDFYEYPVDSSGMIIGYVMAMIRDGSSLIQWMDSKSTDALNYRPLHEVGNLLSYPSNANFNDYYGLIDTIKTRAGYNIGTGGGGTLTMTFTDFSSSSASTQQAFGAELEGKVSYKGQSLSAKGTYNRSSLTTHTSTAMSEIEIVTEFGRTIQNGFDANYTITPRIYWGQNGGLNLGFAVDPSLPGGGLTNFWSQHYTSHPDLSMILPYKYDVEKGIVTADSTDKKRLSKSIVFDKESPLTGDTIEIVTFVHNYSFQDYTGPLELQFYAGNPDKGGILLSDIDGNSLLTVTDLFEARNRTPVTFLWKVPTGITGNTRIYVVLDPANKITELKDDNNTGWFPMGAGLPTDLEAAAPQRTFQPKLYPNPATDHWAQVAFEVPQKGYLNAQILDLQGRTLQVAYDQAIHPGNFILPLDLTNIPNGHYLIKISFNEQVEVLKLVHLSR